MPRFLLVDDSATARRHLAGLLRSACARPPDIVEADGLESALAAFERAQPDAVFLDLQLDLQTTGAPGGANGVLALTLMRQSAPALRVVLVTGLPEDHPDVWEATRSGAMHVLPKPASLEAVRAALRALGEQVAVARG